MKFIHWNLRLCENVYVIVDKSTSKYGHNKFQEHDVSKWIANICQCDTVSEGRDT